MKRARKTSTSVPRMEKIAAPRANASSTPMVATKPATNGLRRSNGWPRRRTALARANSSSATRPGSSVGMVRSSSPWGERSRCLAGRSAIL